MRLWGIPFFLQAHQIGLLEYLQEAWVEEAASAGTPLEGSGVIGQAAKP